MKSILIITLFLITQIIFCQNNFAKTWATYYSDDGTITNDSAIDEFGNVYIVGNTLNTGFIATTACHQTVFGGGSSDGFVTKFSPSGVLLWATFFGGEAGDIIESITIDSLNNVYISGLTSSTTNIASPNSYQPNLNGTTNSFFAKINQNGVVIGQLIIFQI